MVNKDENKSPCLQIYRRDPAVALPTERTLTTADMSIHHHVSIVDSLRKLNFHIENLSESGSGALGSSRSFSAQGGSASTGGVSVMQSALSKALPLVGCHYCQRTLVLYGCRRSTHNPFMEGPWPRNHSLSQTNRLPGRKNDGSLAANIGPDALAASSGFAFNQGQSCIMSILLPRTWSM